MLRNKSPSVYSQIKCWFSALEDTQLDCSGTAVLYMPVYSYETVKSLKYWNS